MILIYLIIKIIVFITYFIKHIYRQIDKYVHLFNMYILVLKYYNVYNNKDKTIRI